MRASSHYFENEVFTMIYAKVFWPVCFGLAVIVVGPSATRAADGAPGWDKVAPLLDKHCARCHQAGKTTGKFKDKPADDFGFILDEDKLVTRNKLILGNADASPIFVKVQKGDMPKDIDDSCYDGTATATTYCGLSKDEVVQLHDAINALKAVPAAAQTVAGNAPPAPAAAPPKAAAIQPQPQAKAAEASAPATPAPATKTAAAGEPSPVPAPTPVTPAAPAPAAAATPAPSQTASAAPAPVTPAAAPAPAAAPTTTPAPSQTAAATPAPVTPAAAPAPAAASTIAPIPVAAPGPTAQRFRDGCRDHPGHLR